MRTNLSPKKGLFYIPKPRKSEVRQFIHIDEYVDNFWKLKIKEGDGTFKIDHKVGNLIHNLLVLGEYNSRELYQIHHKKTMKRHQEYIMAVKEAIKPGFMNYLFKPFTPEMFKGYLHILKVRISMRRNFLNLNLNLSKIHLDVSHGINASIDMSMNEDSEVKATERRGDEETNNSKHGGDKSFSSDSESK